MGSIIQDSVNSSNVAKAIGAAILEYKEKYKSKYAFLVQYSINKYIIKFA